MIEEDHVMPRRAALVGLIATALTVWSALPAAAWATIPVGPHLAIVAGGQLFLTGPDGHQVRRVESEPEGEPGSEPFIGQRPIWSPSGREIAFFSFRIDKPAISLIDADGSHFRLFEGGAEFFYEPAWDPATGELVSEAFGTPEGLTIHPYSFAPDGTAAASLAGPFEGPRNAACIVTFDPHDQLLHTVVPLQANGNVDPVVSPDGSEIAYLHYAYRSSAGGDRGIANTDLMVVPFAGGKAVPLVRITGEAKGPTWDPSGSRLAYAQDHSVFEVNADGTCRTKVYSAPAGGWIGDAAWQPGKGRGVGPLSCRARRGRGR